MVLTALGVQPHHALIQYEKEGEKERCWIELLADGAVNYTFVNGAAVPDRKTKMELVHLDRVVFGSSCTFVVIFKGSTSRDKSLTLPQIDYEYAMNEMQANHFDGGKGSML